MFKYLSIFSMVFAFGVPGFAQAGTYTAPIKWENYRNSELGLSILLPKLPVAIKSSDICTRTDKVTYSTYADEVIYKLIVTSRGKRSVPRYCRGEVFGPQSIFQRLTEIRESADGSGEEKSLKDGREVLRLVDKDTTYWVIDDMENNRWFELSVTHRDDVRPDVDRFLTSIAFSRNPAGIEIGNGAERTLGDSGAAESPDVPATTEVKNPPDVSTLPKLIQLKPRAFYTEAARQNKVQGTMRLKVTFLANGGIGAITAVNELPHGLSEQAISAAQKIVFIPAKRNGVNIATISQVEYSFSIY